MYICKSVYNQSMSYSVRSLSLYSSSILWDFLGHCQKQQRQQFYLYTLYELNIAQNGSIRN